MHPNRQYSGRKGRSAACLLGAALTAAVAGAVGSSAAQAQELTHRFINPSFGGNPFYSEHLLGIAGIHRPEEPKEPTAPPLTQEELLARQLRERLLGQISNEIEDRIEDAQPGDSGEFTLGQNQRISFTRSQTETRVTITNTTTGVSEVIVIPVPGANAAATAAAGRAAAGASAEQVLGAPGASLTPSNSLGLSLPPL